MNNDTLTQNETRAGQHEGHKGTNSVPLSGLYYPNRIVRIFMFTLEDILGKNGVTAMLHHAGLDQYIGNYPPDDLARAFDFTHFTALNIALEDIYGVRGGRGLAMRAGRTAFTQGLKDFGALAGAGDLAFRVLPMTAKLRVGLPAMASIFNNFSDQRTEIAEQDDHFVYTIHACPCCWGRHVDKPVCHGAVGLLQGALIWLSGGLEFRVVQTRCKACEDANCEFIVYKEPLAK